jgi:hypothetical protein
MLSSVNGAHDACEAARTSTRNRRSGTKMHLTLYRDPIEEQIRTTVGIQEVILARYQKSYLGSNGLFRKHICLDPVSKNKSAYAQESQAYSRRRLQAVALSASNI